MAKIASANTELLLTIHEVAELCRLSPATIYRRRGNGTFPEPRKARGKGSPLLWHRQDIEKWAKKPERP